MQFGSDELDLLCALFGKSWHLLLRKIRARFEAIFAIFINGYLVRHSRRHSELCQRFAQGLKPLIEFPVKCNYPSKFKTCAAADVSFRPAAPPSLLWNMMAFLLLFAQGIKK